MITGEADAAPAADGTSVITMEGTEQIAVVKREVWVDDVLVTELLLNADLTSREGTVITFLMEL